MLLQYTFISLMLLLCFSIASPSLVHRNDGVSMEYLRRKNGQTTIFFARGISRKCDKQGTKKSRQANLPGLSYLLRKERNYLLRSVKVATRLNSTSSKSLSVAPRPSVSRRSAEILYFLTSTSLTAFARASESLWLSSGLPSGEA